MKKEYTVLFTDVEGTSHYFVFITENIEKSVKEYCIGKQIASFTIEEEKEIFTKSLLLD